MRQVVPGASSGDRKARLPTVDSSVWRAGSDMVSADRRWGLIPDLQTGAVHQPDTLVPFRGCIHM